MRIQKATLIAALAFRAIELRSLEVRSNYSGRLPAGTVCTRYRKTLLILTMHNASLSAHKFLIIAGTSKAGTTSVFNYLATHPQICPSNEKETRFFLDADYPLPSQKRYYKDGPFAYLSFYDYGREGDWKLEASPDYLYSNNTARLIRATLANVKLVLILREPVSRLLSMYKFGVKMNEIPRTMTFDEYVEVQSGDQNCSALPSSRHPAFRALDHGRYSVYLKSFLEFFGKPSIQVLFHENLSRDPLDFVQKVCRFAGIDERYFEDYSFEVSNRGVQVRASLLHDKYWRTKQRLRAGLRHAPKMRRALRLIGSHVDAVYRRMNWTESQKITMSCSTQDFVRSYYKEESARLREMLGIEVPWREYDGGLTRA